MEPVPTIKEECIVPSIINTVLQRLLTSGQLDTRVVYLDVLQELSLSARTKVSQSIIREVFEHNLRSIALRYLTLRN